MDRKVFITRIAQELMGPPPSAVPYKKRKWTAEEMEEGKWFCPGQQFSMITGEGKKANKHGKKTPKKLDCRLCKVKLNKNKQGRCMCKGCGQPFHVNCFEEWHDKYVTDLKIV